MSLRDHIADLIAREGPMRLDAYMALCLMHPTMGYYTTRDPFGAEGDFTTAPEISQMFGELLGLCLAQTWQAQGSPERFTLAELGPGRGTLMADALRAAGAALPAFVEAAEVLLIEASPAMQARQKETLAPHEARLRWSATFEPPADLPLFVIANEFFDALPIRQFVRRGAHWRERQVGLKEGRLSFGLGPAAPQPALRPWEAETSDGDVVEYAPALAPIVAKMDSVIAAQGGAALIIDYGDWHSLGDTLQALQGHAHVDPLDAPGAADLTAHVDFEALAQAVQHSALTRVTPQGVFLERLGITARAERLAAGMDAATLSAHVAAHRRLTHPEEMGNLFKIAGLYPKAAAPPPGLEP